MTRDNRRWFWAGFLSVFDLSGNHLERFFDEELEKMRREWREQDNAQRHEWGLPVVEDDARLV